MAKLILSKDGDVIREIELTKERTTIGRRAENDIVIDHLAVSGVHAAIIAIVNDVFLEDLNSTNGTWVNGQSVKKHFLQNGDVIELGKYQLQYISNGAFQQHTIGVLEKTGTYPAFGKTPPQPGLPAEATVPFVTPLFAEPAPASQSVPDVPHVSSPVMDVTNNITPLPTQGMLQVLNGARVGKEVALTKSITTLGTPGTQVVAISRRPQGYFLAHVDGAVVPLVNGKPVGKAAYELHENDVIELSGTKVMFYLAS